MDKILIIGTNSFVGRNYINFSKNRDVREVSLFDVKPEEIDFSEVTAVIHLAAIVHQSKTIPAAEYLKVNRDLPVSVATCAKKAGVGQFVFLSTVKVYGDNNPGPWPLNESSVCTPGDPYGKSKLEAEFGLRKMADDNFIVSIIRTPLVYGVGVRANMLSIIKLSDRIPVLPFNNVKNKRCYTFVENLVGYIDRIIERKASGVFIAMDTSPLSTTSLVRLILKSLGKKSVLITVPGFILKIADKIVPGMVNRLYGSFEINNDKTLEILDFQIPFTSEIGIKRMVDSYQVAKLKR